MEDAIFRKTRLLALKKKLALPGELEKFIMGLEVEKSALLLNSRNKEIKIKIYYSSHLEYYWSIYYLQEYQRFSDYLLASKYLIKSFKTINGAKRNLLKYIKNEVVYNE